MIEISLRTIHPAIRPKNSDYICDNSKICAKKLVIWPKILVTRFFWHRLSRLSSNGSRRQSSSTKGFIRKAEITCITVLQSRWKTVHNCCEGNGKVELKSVNSSSSELQCHAGLLPNDCEGVSAIAMRFLVM
jgi:hypothetical protein